MTNNITARAIEAGLLGCTVRTPEKSRRNPPLQGAFPWSPAREMALELVCEDRINDEEIAKTVGISRRTLAYWKQNPAFATAIEERVAAQGARMVEESVAIALRNHR